MPATVPVASMLRSIAPCPAQKAMTRMRSLMVPSKSESEESERKSQCRSVGVSGRVAAGAEAGAEAHGQTGNDRRANRGADDPPLPSLRVARRVFSRLRNRYRCRLNGGHGSVIGLGRRRGQRAGRWRLALRGGALGLSNQALDSLAVLRVRSLAQIDFVRGGGFFRLAHEAIALRDVEEKDRVRLCEVGGFVRVERLAIVAEVVLFRRFFGERLRLTRALIIAARSARSRKREGTQQRTEYRPAHGRFLGISYGVLAKQAFVWDAQAPDSAAMRQLLQLVGLVMPAGPQGFGSVKGQAVPRQLMRALNNCWPVEVAVG